MGNESDLQLAIRTIAVSSRAAIDSSRKLGRPDVAAECAQRGLLMLGGLRERLGADPPEEIRRHYEAAVRELAYAAGASTGEDGRAVPKGMRTGSQPQRGTS